MQAKLVVVYKLEEIYADLRKYQPLPLQRSAWRVQTQSRINYDRMNRMGRGWRSFRCLAAIIKTHSKELS